MSYNTSGNLTERKIFYDDATWVMTSSFIIFTMQSGEYFLYTFRILTSLKTLKNIPLLSLTGWLIVSDRQLKTVTVFLN